jgi:hypothetical protein
MKWALCLLLPLFLATCAIAQVSPITMFTFDGTTETPVANGAFNFGNVAAGANASVTFHARNVTNSPVVVSTLFVVNSDGFSITAINGAIPYSIPPLPSTLNYLAFTVTFNQAGAGTYSANLQLITSNPAVPPINLTLTATAVAPPVLTAVNGCASANGAFNFGSIPIGTTQFCTFALSNPTTQPLQISNIGLTGGFQFQQNPQAPLVLAANQTIQFTVEITPVCGTAFATGTLVVNSQTFLLTGAAITPALPKPLITFDSSNILSGEQHTLTIALASAAVCAAIGSVNLAFTPLSNLPADSTVVFVATNSTSLGFAVGAGSTAVAISGNPSVVFATGSTAGTLTFTMTGPPLAADPTTAIVIPPAIIVIDTATASNQITGQLDVTVNGFDNTYSAGKMSFTFFDAKNDQIGALISADFTAQFTAFYAGQTSGSSFLMNVSFPVQVNQALVATVKATLTNAAGPVQTGTLTFQ